MEFKTSRQKRRKTENPWLGPYAINRKLDKLSLRTEKKHCGNVLKNKANACNLKLFCRRPKCIVKTDAQESDKESITDQKKKETQLKDIEEQTTFISQGEEIQVEDDRQPKNSIDEQNDEKQDDTEQETVSDQEEMEICVEDTEATHKFLPTDKEWMDYHSCRLGLLQHFETMPRCRQDVLTPSKLTNKILGDGNCFFRALSFELSVTQLHHLTLRYPLVSFLQFHKEPFSGYVGKDINIYLSESKMERRSTWATDVETVAAATMLQPSVFVFTEVADRNRKWRAYAPLFHIPDIQTWKDQNIYFSNLCAHFERVTSV